MNGPGVHHNLIAKDIGYFLQWFANLELTLDDVLCLANARRERLGKLLPKKYPNSVLEKIDVAAALSYHLDCQSFAAKDIFERILEGRHQLSHGAITHINPASDGYSLSIAKMGRPTREAGQQTMVRQTYSLSKSEIISFAQVLDDTQDKLRALERAVFGAGDGWPTFLVLPYGDPLGVRQLAEKLK